MKTAIASQDTASFFKKGLNGLSGSILPQVVSLVFDLGKDNYAYLYQNIVRIIAEWEAFVRSPAIIREVFAANTDGAIAKSKMLGVQSANAGSGETAAWTGSRRWLLA